MPTTDNKNLPLARPILAGVLAGIVAAVANLIYNYIYRETVNYTSTDMINAYSIIFGSVLLLMIAGIFYYLIVRYMKGGIVLFILLVILLMAGGYFVRLGIGGANSLSVGSAGGGLIFGVDLITGIGAIILIPYLVHHPRMWE